MTMLLVIALFLLSLSAVGITVALIWLVLNIFQHGNESGGGKMKFKKIPYECLELQGNNTRKDATEKLLSLLGDWEQVDKAVVDVYRVLERHGLWENEAACEELLFLAYSALPCHIGADLPNLLK